MSDKDSVLLAEESRVGETVERVMRRINDAERMVLLLERIAAEGMAGARQLRLEPGFNDIVVKVREKSTEGAYHSITIRVGSELCTLWESDSRAEALRMNAKAVCESRTLRLHALLEIEKNAEWLTEMNEEAERLVAAIERAEKRLGAIRDEAEEAVGWLHTSDVGYENFPALLGVD